MSFSRDGAMRGKQLVWFNTAVLGFYILRCYLHVNRYPI